MHLDQLEELELPIQAYAETMAEALASMHWIAEIDANDVEFVLAPLGDTQICGPTTNAIQSKTLGEHAVWVLDFDCCRAMSMDEEGVAKAVKAFVRNDPFYPRPGIKSSQSPALWDLFTNRYLQMSRSIIEASNKRSGPELPKLFIEGVEEAFRKRPENLAELTGGKGT
jgi:hypothetical protein